MYGVSPQATLPFVTAVSTNISMTDQSRISKNDEVVGSRLGVEVSETEEVGLLGGGCGEGHCAHQGWAGEGNGEERQGLNFSHWFSRVGLMLDLECVMSFVNGYSVAGKDQNFIKSNM